MNAPSLQPITAETPLARFARIRAETEALAAPLSAEDCQVQSMPDASPVKWHLAHGAWFFETFLLTPLLPGYAPFDAAFTSLFNSYYDAVGARHPRPERGLLSRPDLATILAYRAHVDAAMARLLDTPAELWASLLEIGLQHEQQHQELILMDVKHMLSCNPLDPAYRDDPGDTAPPPPFAWIDHQGGLCEIGHAGSGFAFDNEAPRHRVWLDPFRIANRLVTAGEYQGFIADGGYRRPDLWLSDGWATVQAQGWTAPLYWREGPDGWTHFTLAGRRAIGPDEPLVHVSYYEADAYARWIGQRLPTEAEWEVTATSAPGLEQAADSAWQWTGSAYHPYPGYARSTGAIGEYNGKFMVNQIVLRGGAAATPAGHVRPSYRNFFPPSARWCFSGIRLAGTPF